MSLLNVQRKKGFVVGGEQNANVNVRRNKYKWEAKKKKIVKEV